MEQQHLPEALRVAEVELIYRTTVNVRQRPEVTSSGEAFAIFLQHWDTGKLGLIEEFKILLLNRAKRALGLYTVSSGGIATTVADQRLIFAMALKAAASSIILCHNHPSGNLTPSLFDQQVTYRLRDGGKLLNIQVLDHLIVYADGYYSFVDEGLL